MPLIHRPNGDTLSAAIDIYRDTMRPFILACLEKLPGTLKDSSKNVWTRPNLAVALNKRVNHDKNRLRTPPPLVHHQTIPQATRQQSKTGTRNTMRTKWTPEQPIPPAPVIPAHHPSFLRSQDSTRPESTAPTPPKTPPPKMSHCDISPATKVSQMTHFSATKNKF